MEKNGRNIKIAFFILIILWFLLNLMENRQKELQKEKQKKEISK